MVVSGGGDRYESSKISLPALGLMGPIRKKTLAMSLNPLRKIPQEEARFAK
jgi:hypothetical protein